MFWQHNVDPHASHRCHVERLADGIVREKVRCHDPHRFLRRGKRPHQHEFDPTHIAVVGSIADATGQRRARPCEICSP